MNDLIDETGAVLMGKRTFEMGDPDSAGLVDELCVDVMPVFLGTGRRLFEDPSLEGVRLEKTAVREAGMRTSLWFRVTK